MLRVKRTLASTLSLTQLEWGVVFGPHPFFGMRISIDFETRSRCNISDAGTFRYAEDESTSVLMCAIAVDDEDVVLWVPEKDRGYHGWVDPRADEWFAKLRNLGPDDTVHAYNYAFEYAILKNKFAIDIPAKHWRCTQILGQMAGYPNDLDGLTKELCMTDGKLPGKSLINYFCSPITAGKRKGEFRDIREDPMRYWEFCVYCIQDVVVERRAYSILNKAFGLKPNSWTQKAFEITHDMNVKGVPICLESLAHAQEQLDVALVHYVNRFRDAVGCNPTQHAECMKWFTERGYQGTIPDPKTKRPKPSLAVEAVQEELARGHLAPEVQELLTLRSQTTPAAVKKLKKMSFMLCKDGTIKGCFAFYGAAQTGRWSSKGLQFQNMRRSSTESECFYDALKNGADWEYLENWHASFIDGLAGAIRHFINPPEGLVSADYSSIEARLTAWEAQETILLTDFENGVDVYKTMASYLYHKEVDDILPHERQLGKSLVLGAGFGLGDDGFAVNAGCSIEVATPAIEAYRARHQMIVLYWYALKDASIKAIEAPGKPQTVYIPSHKSNGRELPKVTYWYGPMHLNAQGTQVRYLVCTLPSGRRLFYLKPRLTREMRVAKKTGREYEAKQISYWSKDQTSGRMGTKRIWHGTLIENNTQGLAADLMMHGVYYAVRQGFDVRMLIHDEANALQAPGLTHDLLVEAICNKPSWAAGMPLAGEGSTKPYYSK